MKRCVVYDKIISPLANYRTLTRNDSMIPMRPLSMSNSTTFCNSLSTNLWMENDSNNRTINLSSSLATAALYSYKIISIIAYYLTHIFSSREVFCSTTNLSGCVFVVVRCRKFQFSYLKLSWSFATT